MTRFPQKKSKKKEKSLSRVRNDGTFFKMTKRVLVSSLFVLFLVDESFCQSKQKQKKVEIAQLWQHNPRQLHYSDNLSENKTKFFF